MDPFLYVAKTKFQLPQQIIDRILKLDPIDFSVNPTLSRNPIYRQLNVMVVQDQQIDQPITLVDPVVGESLVVTPELLDQLKQRYQLLQQAWNIPYTPFREQSLPPELQDTIKTFLPRSLQDLAPQVAIQSKFEKYGILAPHRDHHRTACLFYLLHSNQEETVWWEKTEDFKEYSFFRFADVSKIKKAHSEILEQNSWYVFDNNAWHSVHPTGPIGRRTAVCIEFNNLPAHELFSIIESL